MFWKRTEDGMEVLCRNLMYKLERVGVPTFLEVGLAKAGRNGLELGAC